ncbi:class I SAM-dependent methyltransferase [soil metagenome]
MDLRNVSTGLQLGQDGIWRAAGAAALSYPSEGHLRCAAVEGASFWFRHRNRCIVAATQRYPPPAGGPIFDIGGGNGHVSLGLAAAGFAVVLLEPGIDGASNAKLRGLDTVVCATTDSAGFLPAVMPAIGVFDVIEHLDDDLAFVQSLQRLLVMGGRLYATVPAHQGLWSQEDVAAGHYRRYSLGSISGLLERAGFRIDFATYFFRPLPLPIFLMRALPHRLGRVQQGVLEPDSMARDHAVQQEWVSRLLERMLAAEISNVSAGHAMRFGASCLLVASKI